MIKMFLILLAYFNCNEFESINCIGYNVQIPVEIEFKLEKDQYTEGVFYDYIFKDYSTLTIHCGYNVYRPFKTNISLTDTFQINDVDVIKYLGKNNSREFIEHFYLNSKITVIAEFEKPDSYSADLIEKVKIIKDR